MKQAEDLRRLLESIDHKSYPAYKSAQGAYAFNGYILSIDHVQGDPFASPSKVSITVPLSKAGYPASLFDTPWKRTAFEDYLVRQFAGEIARYKEAVTPAVILIPGKTGSLGLGAAALQSAVERAVGADIA